MPGMSDYSAKNTLNYATGQVPSPTLPSIFLALFTAVGSDSGSGFTEVSAGGYARVQMSGTLAAGASWTTSSTTLTLGSTAPAWLLALGTNGSGCNVYDSTNGNQIGTLSGISGTTVTLTGTAAHASTGSTDNLVFSAFAPATGSGPSTVTSGAVINMPAASASWGTVIAFGIYDASTSGNLLAWDYLGNFQWLPAFITSASPGVFDVKAHGYSAADTVVYTTEYGGTTPTFSQSNLTGLLAVVSPATDTFTVTNGGTAVNTSSTGDGAVRKVASQAIASGVTASFAAGTFNLSQA